MGIEFLRRKCRELGQQNENNVFENISPVVDAIFNSLKQFVGQEIVLKEIRK
ncbi:MAG: hypothetical protein GX762_01165 [Bacteroidales bacterium]|jgi:hypothetical protein|nr:hypothetical protein [Bacteroidales bacterium]